MKSHQDPVHLSAQKITITPSSSNDEVSIAELIAITKKYWVLLLLITVICTSASITYAILSENIYQSSILLAPVNDDSTNSLGSLSKQLGGFASLAGINLGKGSSNKTSIAIETLQSRSFIVNTLKSKGFVPYLHAAKKWDQNTGDIIINDEMYDLKSKKWKDAAAEPNDWTIYSTFTESNFNLETIEDSGMIRLYFRTISPKLSQEIANMFVHSINEHIKAREQLQANENIEFLKKSIGETNIQEIRQVFYNLLEEQQKTLMLASSQQEYALSVVDPAYLPDEIFSPKRKIIAIGGVAFGLFLSCIFILVATIADNKNKEP